MVNDEQVRPSDVVEARLAAYCRMEAFGMERSVVAMRGLYQKARAQCAKWNIEDQEEVEKLCGPAVFHAFTGTRVEAMLDELADPAAVATLERMDRIRGGEFRRRAHWILQWVYYVAWVVAAVSFVLAGATFVGRLQRELMEGRVTFESGPKVLAWVGPEAAVATVAAEWMVLMLAVCAMACSAWSGLRLDATVHKLRSRS